jgi:pectin methylesterase-like acyl-CoA thioesterase
MKSVVAMSMLILCATHATFAIGAKAFYPTNGTTGQCLDTPLRIELDSKPVLGFKGAIRIKNLATNTVIKTWNMATNPGDPNLVSVAAAWPWKDSVGITYRNVWPIVVDSIPNYLVEIRVPKNLLKANTQYQVEMDPGVIKSTTGSEFTGVSAGAWKFTTGSTPTAKNSLTVSADNSGDVCSIGRAIELVPSNSTATVRVLVKPGYYREMIAAKNKNNLELYGAGTDKTFIRYLNSNNLNEGSSLRGIISLGGNKISIRALSISNTISVTGAQAEALYLQGDQSIVADVFLHSYQDTWLNSGGRAYIQDATIEGSVDYIWGYNPAFFKRVTLVMNRKGSVIVQPRNSGTTHGYVFDSCTIKAEKPEYTASNFARDGGASYNLGEAIFLHTRIESSTILNANPWSIGTSVDASKILFCEYKSTDKNGVLLNITDTNRKKRQCSADTATKHQAASFVLNGWTPAMPSLATVLALTATTPVIPNKVPVVSMTAPIANAAYTIGTTTIFTATVSDADGTVSKVAFIARAANTTTLIAACSDTTSPYSCTWIAPNATTYNVYAIAIDNKNDTTKSNSVNISILPLPTAIATSQNTLAVKAPVLLSLAQVRSLAQNGQLKIWNTLGAQVGIGQLKVGLYVIRFNSPNTQSWKGVVRVFP